MVLNTFKCDCLTPLHFKGLINSYRLLSYLAFEVQLFWCVSGREDSCIVHWYVSTFCSWCVYPLCSSRPFHSHIFALCGLWGCKNRAHSISWQRSEKAYQTRYYVLGRAGFCVWLLCLRCMQCFLSLFLVVNTSATNCLERLVTKVGH